MIKSAPSSATPNLLPQAAHTKIALQISNFPADSPIYTPTKRLMKKTIQEIASETPHGNGISANLRLVNKIQRHHRPTESIAAITLRFIFWWLIPAVCPKLFSLSLVKTERQLGFFVFTIFARSTMTSVNILTQCQVELLFMALRYRAQPHWRCGRVRYSNVCGFTISPWALKHAKFLTANITVCAQSWMCILAKFGEKLGMLRAKGLLFYYDILHLAQQFKTPIVPFLILDSSI